MTQPSTSGPSSALAGYTLVLPPGWARVPLRSGTEDAIERIVGGTFSGISRDQAATPRHQLRQRLRDQARTAGNASGIDLYLPTERMHGFTIAASFVVADLAFGSVQPLDPALVMGRLRGEGESAAVDVDGAKGVRSESTTPPEGDIPFGARRVEYTLPVPDDPDRFLVVTFSTFGQGEPVDELADLLVELFDAIMSTFRWRTA